MTASSTASSLAGSIRERRRAAGLTQRQLASAAGIGVGIVRDMEQGVTRQPHRQSLLLLAMALGLESDEAAGLIEAGTAVLAERLAVGAGRGLRWQAQLGGPDRRESDSTMWCGILGPLEILGSRGPVRLGGPRHHAVLGLLATSPNAVVERRSIIDALWPEEPPPSAVTMIHSYIAQLRRLLPAGHPATGLVTVGSGYRLNVRGDELDLLVFSRRSSLAGQARDAGDLAAAFGLFGEALALWRGEPLADIELLYGHPAIAGLRAQRAAAIIDYAEAARSRREHEAAIPHLRALAAREPLNERAHACLMSALAQSGQQAAALEVFSEIRLRLDEQLGVAPAAELTEAHLRVLRGSQPDGQSAGWQAPEDQPGGVSLSPCQLPAAIPNFTGREAELGQLARIIGGGPAVEVPLALITGLPGAGKTALALRAAHEMRARFPDGQLWVQLDGASERPRQPADLLGELLRSLGVPGAAIPDTLAEKAAMYRSRLADRRVLIVIDDAAAVEQVLPLIPGTAGSAVIVTSRMQLGELHGARVMALDLLGHEEAVDLLARIVGRQRVRADKQAAERLVRACGRLPLAVRIAGARLARRPSWPVSLMSDALADQQRRLDELESGSLSVRASFAMSYQALDQRAQRALCFLSTLGPTDVAEWAIAAMLGVADASDVVNRLTDSSLLSSVGSDATGAARYRLHDLVRDFAGERLAGDHERERPAALRRVAMAWLQLAAAADSRLPSEPYFPPPAGPQEPDELPAGVAGRLTADPVAWFSAERRNLIGVVEHCCQAGDHALAAALAARLAAYQHVTSRLDDAHDIWRAIVQAARQAGDPDAAARAELRAAAVMCGLGRHAEALPVVERCAATFGALGDGRAVAAALYWKSACQANLGSFRDGMATATSALSLARQRGDRQIELLALRIIAITQAQLPAFRDAANDSCAQALAVARELGQPAWEYEILHTVGHVANLTGRPQAAIDTYTQSLEFRKKLGVTVDEGSWLGILGDAEQALGHYRRAAHAYQQALPIFRRQFMGRHQGLCLLKLSHCYRAMGQFGQAIASAQESLPIFTELRLAHYADRASRAIEECRRALPAEAGAEPGQPR
ncbi:MAG TPA: BTAD domain-containing putative transcriptional regulator [Streptosporangiaceae bacterium]